MNERIKELTVEANDQTGNKFDLNYKPLDAFFGKFSELIVRECVKNLETNKKCDIYTGELTDCDWNDVIQQQIDSLKENFGVKE